MDTVPIRCPLVWHSNKTLTRKRAENMEAPAQLNGSRGHALTYELVRCHLIHHVLQPTEALITRADGDEQ